MKVQAGAFQHRSQWTTAATSTLRYVATSRPCATSLAENYFGLPEL